MTKHHYLIIALLNVVLYGFFTGCSDDDDEELVGNWVALSVLDGMARADAVSFPIDDKVYVGTGYNGTEDERLKDFWQYDATKDMWTRIANFPGAARNGAVAFTVNGKGYVGTGYSKVTNESGITEMTKMNDFYEYDPTLNTWRQISNFAGSGRYAAVGFGIGDYGYVGTGYDGNVLKDFFKYDPNSDTWSEVSSIRGSKRRDAVAFVIDNKAYVVTGVDNGSYVKDFYVYDPETDYWTEKRKIYNSSSDSYDDDYNIVGAYGVAFTMNGKGYVSTGGAGSAGSLTWEYNPTTDLWSEKSNFEGSPRLDAVGFSVNDRGYVSTGRSSGYYFDDIWSFYPNDDQDDED
jgi:N-acetylneuraminic acid mutarotase